MRGRRGTRFHADHLPEILVVDDGEYLAVSGEVAGNLPELSALTRVRKVPMDILQLAPHREWHFGVNFHFGIHDRLSISSGR